MAPPSRPAPLSHPATRRQPGRWRASTVRLLLLATTLLAVAPLAWMLFALDPPAADGGGGGGAFGPGSADTGARAAAAAAGPFPSPRATVAYAVSLTSCGSAADGGHSSDPSFHEGAAVLKHSVHLSSVRNHKRSGSVFDYKMIAFVHPAALPCSSIFDELGYEVQVRETPFNVTDIKKQFLREHVVKSGCCGEKEYLKLYAYALMEYPIVIHLDLDSLVLKPLDDIFHAMLGDAGGRFSEEVDGARSRISVMHGDPLPASIDAYFTRDYNMVNPGHKHVGVQGGFLVVKPNMDAFREYVDIVLEGRFFQGSGWEGKGYGGYFGAQQIQGICSFYYDHRHPGTAVELNKCYYNVMADAPRQRASGQVKPGQCRDGREECQDCRDAPVADVKSVHFTICTKPWKCPMWVGQDDKTKRACAAFHSEWFRVREDLDRVRATEQRSEYSKPGGEYKPEVFRGYCSSNGERGYSPLGSD